MTDHDRLFKELLTTFFADFIALFFPELSAYLDADSVTFLDKEVFTDVTEGEQHEADIVARARFRSDTGNPAVPADAIFLVHIENQSYAQAEFGRRMFPFRAEPDRFTVAFPDLPVLEFRFRVVQLNRLSWRDFVNTPNPVASALMAKMKIAPEDRWRVKWECLRLLATLRLVSGANAADFRLCGLIFEIVPRRERGIYAGNAGRKINRTGVRSIGNYNKLERRRLNSRTRRGPRKYHRAAACATVRAAC